MKSGTTDWRLRMGLGLLAMGLAWPGAPADAAVPTTLSIEGVLLTAAGGPVSDGKYAVTFNLYANSGAKTPAWTDTVAALSVQDGTFQFALGSGKALPVAMVDSAKTGWLGIVVGNEPELPRSPFHAAPFAIRAAISQDVDFPYAGSLTKGGPAKDLACTGCVSLQELKIDGDLDLGGNALKAKQVSATTVTAGAFVGDGSKLTGLKTPAGQCKAGLVVTGIDGAGQLICVSTADALPKDGLDTVSNGVLTTEFVDAVSGKTKTGIPDNNPIGVADAIIVPDLGTAKKLTVTVHVTNSSLKHVKVMLFDPLKGAHVLFDKGKDGKELKGTWPTPDKQLSGDLTSWWGKNAKGTWQLKVIDDAFINNTTDGFIESWRIDIETLSNKKVQANGELLAKGGFQFPIFAAAPYACDAARYGFSYLNSKDDELYVCRTKGWTAALFRQCGNGIKEFGEDCDDGNQKDGDQCAADCVFKCGDGICSPEKNETSQSCNKDCKIPDPWIESSWTLWYAVPYPHPIWKESLGISVCKSHGLRLWRDMSGSKSDANYAYDYNGQHNLGGHDICYKVNSATGGGQQGHTGTWKTFGKKWADEIKATAGAKDGQQVIILNAEAHSGPVENSASYCTVTPNGNSVGWNGQSNGSPGLSKAIVLCANHK